MRGRHCSRLESRSRTEQQLDVVHAIGICRWVLELFADPHRFDTPAPARAPQTWTKPSGWCHPGSTCVP
ncbi:MAG: hypothetical protein U0792_23305 [Gemmataceae bacterium]